MNKQKIIDRIQAYINTKYSIENAALLFITIILMRLGIEEWINGFAVRPMSFYFYEFLHTSSFFLLFFIICSVLLTKIAKIKPKISVFITLFAFIGIIFPPIFDWVISNVFFNGSEFVSYYLFDNIQGLGKSFVTFFGDSPHDGITYGSRIMVFFAIIFLTATTWLSTKKITRTILMLIIIYITAFILSSLPSIITFIASDQHLEAARATVAGFIASPTIILGNKITYLLSVIYVKMSLIYILIDIVAVLLISWYIYKKTFIELIKNIRPVQTAYHIGLLLVGIYTAIVFNDAVIIYSFFSLVAFLILCIAIIFAWYSTVIFNDCIDQKIDKISNPTRPLITGIIDCKTYKKIGVVLVVLSIVMTAAINSRAAIILIIYHALSFIYNTPPLRLKRFPIIATLLAAIASFFVIVIGFITISPEHSLDGFPTMLTMLLIVSFTISIPIKDLKDIAGDKANNIYTLPVIFGEKTARTIIASCIFFSFILSIITLGVKSALIPAVLSGALSFWILVGNKNGKFVFAPKQTISTVFLVVAIYAIILAFSLFN